MRPTLDSHAIRIRQLLFGGAILFMAYTTVRSMMGGGMGRMPVFALLIVLVTIILLMDRHYWMLCPLGFWSQSLIRVPFLDIAEIGCLAVIGTHFVRRALRRETHTEFRPAVLWAAPYFLWAALAYLMNPSGLYLVGGTTIGARFYFKMLIAFWAMIVLSIQQIDENDCRRLFQLAILFSVWGLARSILARTLVEAVSSVTAYEFLASAVLVYWLFAHFRTRQFLGVSWRPLVTIFLIALTIYTGKRRAVFNVAVYPLLRALIARQDRGLALVLGFLAALALGFILMGQGRLYELPIPAQRGLSFLPAKWDPSIAVYEGGRDPFREIVHEYAWEEVRRNPWFGRRGYAIDLEELQWINFSRTSAQFEGHGTSGNWHNTWIGMMADFGIPGAAFWGVFSLAYLWVGISKLRRSAPSSFQHTLLMYCIMDVVLMLLASNTSGHSALQPFRHWPMFGLLLGIRLPSPPPTSDS